VETDGRMKVGLVFCGPCKVSSSPETGKRPETTGSAGTHGPLTKPKFANITAVLLAITGLLQLFQFRANAGSPTFCALFGFIGQGSLN
jgi:hypothetical protein